MNFYKAMRFRDRKDAGKQLAAKLSVYAERKDVVLLALPRGGVPVASEIAKALHLSLDVFLVRKLGIPRHEETAMGAIAIGDVVFIDQDLVNRVGIPQRAIEQVIIKEKKELERRNIMYRSGKPPLDLKNKTVILVDDGLATGSTMHAAVAALKEQNVGQIIVAVPVSSDSAYRELSQEADKVICLSVPEDFYAVGQWYGHFPQTSDQEVLDLLSQASLYEVGNSHANFQKVGTA